MNRKQLLYKLTGTENPRFITERENKIIEVCLGIINDLEQDVKNASSNQSCDSPNSSTNKALDDYEFNLHKHWKDDDNNENNNNDRDSGSIGHFRD